MPLRFFTDVDDKVWSFSTFEALLALQDNYDADVRHHEDHTAEEQAEEEAFLSSVMATKVMKKAYEFLSDKGQIYTPGY